MEFRSFTEQSVQATRKRWLKLAKENNGFAPDIEQVLNWTEAHTRIVENEIAYGVFSAGSDSAIGICELIVTRKSSKVGWVKFIRLRLDPEIDAQIFNNKSEGVVSAVEAYIACVVGVLGVKDAHDASTIKVYGRTQEQMKFLTVLSASLQKREMLKFTSEIEGRWLVLNWGKS